MIPGFYKPLGFLFLALGLLEMTCRVLPSTPFILLAAWFFARSSEYWHRRLLDSQLFGPMILNWERNPLDLLPYEGGGDSIDEPSAAPGQLRSAREDYRLAPGDRGTDGRGLCHDPVAEHLRPSPGPG